MKSFGIVLMLLIAVWAGWNFATEQYLLGIFDLVCIGIMFKSHLEDEAFAKKLRDDRESFLRALCRW